MKIDTHPRLIQPQVLEKFLNAARLAPSQSHKALTLWPLIGPSRRDAAAPAAQKGARAPLYIALADAIHAGTFFISEVSEHGSVPHVVAENRGEVAVLVLFGEELRGAKQNRIANATFLVGPHSRVVLDVSCVEAGRWARDSESFAASGIVFSSESRSKMVRRVAASREVGRGFVANQSEVWDEVERQLSRSGVASETRAYADHMSACESDFDEAGHDFEPLEGQVGFVAAIGTRVAGLEIVGRPEVFARTFRGLLASYLVDALEPSRRHVERKRWRSRRDPARSVRPNRFDAPEPFLRAVGRSEAKRGASIGLGEDWRLRGHGIEGCALVAGEVVHVTAFPDPGDVA